MKIHILFFLAILCGSELFSGALNEKKQQKKSDIDIGLLATHDKIEESWPQEQKRTYSHPRCKYIGEFTYHGTINVKSWIAKSFFSIGKFCSIAGPLNIFLDGNHRVDWISTYPFPGFADKFPEAKHIEDYVATHGDVVIGNDVWIGQDVTILSGVTIGDGAVIGAHSVVGKSIPPYAIAVGNPAKIVRYRFDQATIDLLLKTQWWNWPIELIRRHCHLLCSNRTQDFLKICETICLKNATPSDS